MWELPTKRKMNGCLDDVLLGTVAWYLTGMVMFLGFSLGFQFLVRSHNAAPPDAGFLGAFAIYDGFSYKRVVEEGYEFNPKAQSNIAFFPVYPLSARWVRAATGLSTEAALLLVSNASLLGAFILLARYLRARFPTAQRAAGNTERPAAGDTAQPAARDTAPCRLVDATLVALGLFPTGCFFRMCYTEAPFLLLIVAAMYGIQRRWPLWAVISIVGLATATRAAGVALLAPLAIHIWRSQPTKAARAWRLAFWLPLACWGLAGFMAFQYVEFGDPLACAHAHGQWRIRPALALPDKAAALATFEPLRAVYDPRSPAYWKAFDRHGTPWFSLAFANPIFLVAALALLALGVWKRWITPGETWLGALMLLIPYLSRAHEMGMGSMGRFVSVVFPIYLVLGQIATRLPFAVGTSLFAVAAFYLAVYSALFAAGYLIF